MKRQEVRPAITHRTCRQARMKAMSSTAVSGRRRGRAAIGVAFAALVALPVPSASARQMEQRVLDAVQSARNRSGIDPLRRRADLDGVALERARAIARLPHDRRLAMGRSIEEPLREAGIVRFRTAAVYLDLKKGYADTASAFVSSWSELERSWAKALSPSFDSIGLATRQTPDGWIILVAILLEEREQLALPDLRKLERETTRAANEVRRDHGLSALSVNPLLVEVARAHSEGMARRGFFDHRSHDGRMPKDRVRARGLSYRAVAENIHMSRGVEDPARSAIRSWLGSKSHRKTLLAPSYTETGLGVAVTEDGTLYFTQLFMLPES